METAVPPTEHCPYCNVDVPAAQMTDEHIWPNALGGDPLPHDMWRTKACATCNGRSGVYVDGAFIKSWIGQAERATGNDPYLSPLQPLTTPIAFNYLGSLADNAPEGETIDWWVLSCGANVLHFRPEDDDELFARYAGGDPRRTRKKRTAGRAYLAHSSPVVFWQSVAVASFNKQFKRAQRHVVTKLDPSLAGEVAAIDPTNPQHEQDMRVIEKLLTTEKHRFNIPLDAALGNRLLAKLGLALGYQLFGRPFGDTDYARELRSAFREADPEKLKSSKLRGSGILGPGTLGPVQDLLRWPGGWVLWIKRQDGKALLQVITPSAKLMLIMITDDPDLTDTLDSSYDDGLVWVTVPTIEEAVGPIPVEDYLEHQAGNVAHPGLTKLANRRIDPTLLPACGF